MAHTGCGMSLRVPFRRCNPNSHRMGRIVLETHVEAFFERKARIKEPTRVVGGKWQPEGDGRGI